MSIPDYSVLAGHPFDGELVWPHNQQKPPHFMIKVHAGSKTCSVAVNVQSQDLSEVLYRIDFQFRPPQEDALRALSEGLTALDSEPGGLALDFVRQGLVRREDMQLLPKPSLGHGSQLLGAIQTLTAAAHQDPDSVLYAFGSAFPDGIHDIHMNQGNPPPHEPDNGVYRDGAVFLFLPASQRWVGVFLAFQTQVWTTDANGNPAAAVADVAPVSFSLPEAATEAVPFVPRLFAATRPTLEHPSASRPVGRGNQYFHKPPPPTRPAPHRIALAEAVPPAEMARIAAGGRLVFHAAGDTGNAGHDLGYQLNVGKHMERQLAPPNPGDRPAFLYLLGDVVYFNGEESKYASQFFDVYDFYKAPVFAIPGNHDGDNLPGDASLAAFVKHFCAPAPAHPPAAHEAVRDAMTQPNPYWTLTSPLLTVIGLYTNVPEHGLLDDPDGGAHPQEDWFQKELAEAPTDRPVIVALHHPPYSLDKGHGASDRMAELLERAMVKTGRAPAAVFTGHVHNYQRYTRRRGGAEIPHVVAGCGGYPAFHQMLAAFPRPSATPWPDVTLDDFEVPRKGFLRVTVTASLLTCEFFTVPLPDEPEDGPTVLRDRFVLDWKRALLITDQAPAPRRSVIIRLNSAHLDRENDRMPHIRVNGTDVEYDLIAYDAAGVERKDDPDGRMTDRVLDGVGREPVTDVFLMSHGWQGDVPAARHQYDAWVGAMAGCRADRERARRRPDFRPLVVGLHWPSLPWGDEKFGAAAVAFASFASAPPETWVEQYAQRIADTPEARQALQTVFTAAQRDPSPAQLPDDARAAYAILNQEAGLGAEGEGGAPGDDREPFDPEDRYQAARQESLISFGATDVVGDLLSPLRQLSFWKMKDRARRFGESGAHAFLRALLGAREGIRIHMMGHSFGCIVVSAAVAGPAGAAGLPRPVQSLALIQGAFSLWSYCADIPYRRGRAGYFRRVADVRLVAGPIITTQSSFDRAVGRWYPLGAGAARQIDFAPGELPPYGGVGTFGLRGPGLELADLDLRASDHPYDFQGGRIYNLESSGVIRNGGGASGAHSDIAHPEVAHAVWAAALV